MSALSGDARMMANLFVMTSELTFQMVKGRPTKRCQAALDELVKAGVVSAEPYNRLGGVVYKRCWTVDACKKLSRGVDKQKHSFTISEPIQ